MSSEYGEDLAYVHHTGFGEFAESASQGLLEILWKHGIRDGLVVDVGCGSGIWARELTRAGFEVLGIDASPAMIALARITAPSARFIVGSFADAAIPSCRAITAIGEVLNYGRFDDVSAFFARASEALAPNGLLVFDVAERGSYLDSADTRVDGDDFVVIATKESDETHLTRRITAFREVGGVSRKTHETHTLELYARAAVTRALREAGFRVRVRRSYGTRRLPRGHAVYICVKA